MLTKTTISAALFGTMALAVATPGIFWANSGVLASQKAALPYDKYVKWYEEVHILDWMGAKKGAITAAWRYQSLDAERTLPFLVTYKYPDISELSAPEFGQVSLSHPSLPEGGPITKFARFEVLSGSHVETWRGVSTGDGMRSFQSGYLSNGQITDIYRIDRGPLLVTETIDSGNIPAERVDKWYRETYINDLSGIKGWRRTSRFVGSQQPKWFALHEFEDGSFGANIKLPGLLGNSSGTKEIANSVKKADLALWRLVREYGNATTAWGQQGGDKIVGS